MKTRTILRLGLAVLGFVCAFLLSQGGELRAQGRFRVTAYYAGWSEGANDDGVLPSGSIDYSAVTDIIHFSLVPLASGALDYASNSITTGNSQRLLARAHAAGVRVLISVGGWASDAGFRGATSPAMLDAFTGGLIDFMSDRGYDGVDIDWETLKDADSTQYTAFLKLLWDRTRSRSPKPVITGAFASTPKWIGSVERYFDQINLMSYDLSGAWNGWVSWHNSPIYDGGAKFPRSDRPLPSIDGMVNEFTASGAPRAKLMIGIDFYGYVWSGGSGSPTGGVAEPRQSWDNPPQVQSNVPFSTIYKDYFRPGRYRWDTAAQAAYLSINPSPDLANKFISFDDENTCRKKIEYAKSKGLGGVFIWELGGGYLPATYPERDRLLQAVKGAWSK